MKFFAAVIFVAAFAINSPADVLYNDIPNPPGNPVTAGGAFPIADSTAALPGDGPLYDSFTSTFNGSLSDIALVLGLPVDPPGASFTVNLYNDSGSNTPGTLYAVLATIQDSSLTGVPEVYSCGAGSITPCNLGEALTAGTRYWIGLSNVDPNNETAAAWFTVSTPVGPDGGSQVGVANEFWASNSAGTTQVNQNFASTPFLMTVSATSTGVPEPSAAFVFAVGLGLLAGFGWRRRRAETRQLLVN